MFIVKIRYLHPLYFMLSPLPGLKVFYRGWDMQPTQHQQPVLLTRWTGVSELYTMGFVDW